MLQDVGKLALDGETFDVIVIGAGGAGMSAALFAAIDGARVLLVERTEYVGGTTAWSAGTTWIPGTRHATSASKGDTLQRAETYLQRAVGDRTPRALRRAFLEHGPAAVDHVEENSEVKYRAYPLHPDYLSELEGSTVRGRALEPLPFDGRKLGDLLALLRPPIPEFTVLGGMMVDRNDIFHLLRMTQSLASFKHASTILGRHLVDRMRHKRGTRLVMGNALVGRLLYSLAQRTNVSLAINTSVEEIVSDASGTHGVTLFQNGHRRAIKVKGGVILASGGFNRHPQLRKQMLPGADPAWCAGAPGHTGAAHDLVRETGAHYGTGSLSNAFWAPVSIRKRRDGSTAVFPHFLLDRGKPGVITVNRSGKRFLNETTSYHLFGIAMQEEHKKTSSIPAYLIADADAVRKYGIGMVRPGGKGFGAFIADGYLVQATTLEELAAKLDLDAQGLKDSVERNNRYAQTGVDEDFDRGTTAYARNLGDPAWRGPNPNIGPLRQPPYYAVRLYPGDIGAATGFVTDATARVLDANDHAIPGLYAIGNDMHSIMGGVYPAPGITLGPALVFGYLAGRDAAQRAGTGPGWNTRRDNMAAPASRQEPLHAQQS